MKKFKVTSRDGQKFEYTAERPIPDQPEWGSGYTLEVEDVSADLAAKEQAKEDRRAAIRGMGSANSVAALRVVVRAMAEELGMKVD